MAEPKKLSVNCPGILRFKLQDQVHTVIKYLAFGERMLVVLKTPLPASARCRITNPPQGKPCVAFFALMVAFKSPGQRKK